jgi:hypothetical protein
MMKMNKQPKQNNLLAFIVGLTGLIGIALSLILGYEIKIKVVKKLENEKDEEDE